MLNIYLPQEVLIFMLTPGSANALFDPRGRGCCFFCFGELTFPKPFYLPSLSTHFFFPYHCFVAPLPFLSVSRNLHLLCVLLFQTHLLSLYISLLILIPLFFSHSLFHQSNPHSYVSWHFPTIFLILGCLSYFAPISHTLPPPLLHYSPLPISPPIPVFLVSG